MNANVRNVLIFLFLIWLTYMAAKGITNQPNYDHCQTSACVPASTH